jgi:K+ transporter
MNRKTITIIFAILCGAFLATNTYSLIVGGPNLITIMAIVLCVMGLYSNVRMLIKMR